MAYEYAVSSEWITTTGRPHADRCRIDVYPIIESKHARWGDLDVYGHLNHLALEALHEDARAGINEQYVPGTYDPATDTFRLVASQNVVHFLAEAHWPANILVGIGIGGLGQFRRRVLWTVHRRPVHQRLRHDLGSCQRRGPARVSRRHSRSDAQTDAAPLATAVVSRRLPGRHRVGDNTPTGERRAPIRTLRAVSRAA